MILRIGFIKIITMPDTPIKIAHIEKQDKVFKINKKFLTSDKYKLEKEKKDDFLLSYYLLTGIGWEQSRCWSYPGWD